MIRDFEGTFFFTVLVNWRLIGAENLSDFVIEIDNLAKKTQPLSD